MKITESKDEIVLRDIPLFYWFSGAACGFVFGSFFVWLIVYALYNPREIFNPDGAGLTGKVLAIFMFVLVLVFLGGFLYLFFSMILMPVITTNINRNTKTVEVSRKNLFKKTIQKFYFPQIKVFGVNKVAVRNSPTYYLVLFLVNNLQIEIETKARSENEVAKLAEKLNSFIKSEK